MNTFCLLNIPRITSPKKKAIGNLSKALWMQKAKSKRVTREHKPGKSLCFPLYAQFQRMRKREKHNKTSAGTCEKRIVQRMKVIKCNSLAYESMPDCLALYRTEVCWCLCLFSVVKCAGVLRSSRHHAMFCLFCGLAVLRPSAGIGILAHVLRCSARLSACSAVLRFCVFCSVVLFCFSANFETGGGKDHV